jgi:hypothetical protein
VGDIREADANFRAAVFYFQKTDSMTEEHTRSFIYNVSAISEWPGQQVPSSRVLEYANWASMMAKSRFGEQDKLTATCYSRLARLEDRLSPPPKHVSRFKKLSRLFEKKSTTRRKNELP